jgi:hypothetical protein
MSAKRAGGVPVPDKGLVRCMFVVAGLKVGCYIGNEPKW